ncbi:DUF4124 domain-containing protein [Bowmanella dokdonensis]|uniref:DUF4124 domain-containing protein n=1 Tax=Bowmanella dokdonensis TaxID=751969 RepID=A0A939DJH6_9ALTE|nr:DUF4124 domain-containing protein [Bowmanella dokdonensis]MBN7823685.1 DUF4124 domain-containing protein [Bowmanella dokdonensis]
MKIYSLLLLLLISTVQAATLYKLVKADGTVVFTDQPVEGAVPVDLPQINTAKPLAAKPVVPPPDARSSRPQVQYQVAITTPAPEATLRDNLGRVQIQASVQPDPRGAGSYQLLLDGKVVETSPSPGFSLSGVNRGEHSIQVNFLSNSGKILASSPQQVFYLHQASALINPR